MSKKYTIELTEKQLEMIDAACELKARILFGQLLMSDFQELLEEAWERNHPGHTKDEWWNMRTMLDRTLLGLQDYIFAGQLNGVGNIDQADILWDIHKCCEHERFLALSPEVRETFKNTVMADTPRAYGDEPLITIKEI